MAERRMFTQKIVDSDAFLDMPLSAQALYFHLNMRADDDGFVNNTFSIMRMLGLGRENLEILLDKGLVDANIADGTFRIKHWRENNGIGENSKKRNDYAYRKWRKQVIERDGVCQRCGGNEKLEAHHIKDFALYPFERLELNNGIALCEKCHKQVHKERRKNGRC